MLRPSSPSEYSSYASEHTRTDSPGPNDITQFRETALNGIENSEINRPETSLSGGHTSNTAYTTEKDILLPTNSAIQSTIKRLSISQDRHLALITSRREFRARRSTKKIFDFLSLHSVCARR